MAEKDPYFLDLRRIKRRLWLLAIGGLALLELLNFAVFDMSAGAVFRDWLLGGALALALIEIGFRQAGRLQRRLRLELDQKQQVARQLRLQSTALQAAANAIVMTTPQGVITWVNPAFTRLTGYQAAEAVGQTPRLLNSGHHEPAFFTTLWQTILSGQVWHGETVNRRKDGRLYVEEQTIAPVLDEDGQIAHFISIKQDITERRRAYEFERQQRQLAEALRDAGTRLSATLELDRLLDELLLAVDRLVPYDAANVSWIDGHQAVVTRSRGYEEMDPTFAPRVGQVVLNVATTPNLRRMVASGQPLRIPDVTADPDWLPHTASARTRSWMGVPIRQGNTVVGLFALEKTEVDFYRPEHAELLATFATQAGLALQNARLFAAVQEQAAALDELNAGLEQRVAKRTRDLAQANERLQELDRLKSKFVADVSHELRTPITNMSMYLDLLERGRPERRDHYLDVLKQETVRLRGLVESIFDLTRLELAGQQPPALEAIDLNAMITELLADARAQAAAAGLQLHQTLDPALPPVQGEPAQLRQMAHNLLVNALNYTPSGTVMVRTFQENGSVCLQVQDTGVGISAADLPHVFDHFYRGQPASQSTIPGAGLGLGIVREIARQHQGEVTVDTEEGRGATFLVRLPAISD